MMKFIQGAFVADPVGDRANVTRGSFIKAKQSYFLSFVCNLLQFYPRIYPNNIRKCVGFLSEI